MAIPKLRTQIDNYEVLANNTTYKHLGDIFQLQPELISKYIDVLFSGYNIYSDNPLTTYLNGITNGVQTINNTEYEWQLQNPSVRPLVITEKITAGASGQVGLNLRPFKIKLDENWWIKTDVISPGTSSKKYQCIIVDSPYKQDGGWIYTVRMITDDPNMFIPDSYLAPNTQWAKLYSSSGEGADKGGSTVFSTPISFKGKLSKYRKQYEVTDYASESILKVGLPDANNKYHKTWMRYADASFMMQWKREQEIALWYSRSSETITQDNGLKYTMSAGIQEQLEDSNIQYYSKLTLELLENFIMDIFYGRTKPQVGSRNLTIFTGEYGMAEFNKMINEDFRKSGLTLDTAVKGVSSSLHSNAYEYGMQFVKLNLTNGITATLIQNPLYDDRNLNSELDPITNAPISSKRFTILDMSGDGNSSNIKIIKKANGDNFAYVCGLYSPHGPSKRSDKPANAKDSYEMHIGCHQGIFIKDIGTCGELIFQPN